jgi:hypothetical protein
MLSPFSLFASLRWPLRKGSSLAASRLTNKKFESSSTLTAACRSRKAIGKLMTVLLELEEPRISLATATLIEDVLEILPHIPKKHKLAFLNLAMARIRKDLGLKLDQEEV